MSIAVGKCKALLNRMELRATARPDRFPGIAKIVGLILAQTQHVSICLTLAVLANKSARFVDVTAAKEQLEVDFPSISSASLLVSPPGLPLVMLSPLC